MKQGFFETLFRPAVMAIVNVTPDSFFAASRTTDRAAILEKVREAVDGGAAILDVGGYSSRPGADDVSPDEELRRVSMALEVVRENYGDFSVSLDTFRSSVAQAVVERFGDCIINDISGGEADPAIIDVAARFDLPFVAMHMRGTPQTMQQHTDYECVVSEVAEFFKRKIAALRHRGVNKVIIDPGFGFAKTMPQNYQLLAQLATLTRFECPILAGLSRKSMIYKLLDTMPENSLAATTALSWEALSRGATILRVHDVRPASDIVRLYEYYSDIKTQYNDKS